MTDGGRRDRQRQATRQELSRTALRLALERGPERVRVEDIAAAADTSLRTFHNHFANKEQAIVALGVARAGQIGAALAARPAGEPLADALAEAYVVHHAAGDLDADGLARIRLVVSSPTLRGEYLKSLEPVEAVLAEAIAARTGRDGLYPRVLAAAVSAAVRVTVAYWLEQGPPDGLAPLLRAAIHHVIPEG